jgi:hypothetical protein
MEHKATTKRQTVGSGKVWFWNRNKCNLVNNIVNMKKISFVSTIITCCFVMGCSLDDSKMNQLSDEQKMLTVISKYITMENDQYVMNLSEEDAIQLGISEDFYASVADDIVNLNTIIREGLEREKTDPNYSIVFPGRQTSQETEINHHIRLKDGNETGGSSWTSCVSRSFDYNQSTHPTLMSFSIPKKTKKVKFVLTSKDRTAQVQLEINKNGNSYGYNMSIDQVVTLVFSSYSSDNREKEIVPSSKAATWDIDITPQVNSGTVTASYLK